MNISHIHYAVEVAHYGSFNKAAANLFVSQPSLSRAIKELERELGFNLFLRTPNGVVPTHQGKEFLHRAKHLDNQYIALWDQYVVNSHAPTVQLSLAAFRCVIVEFALIKLYNRYREGEYLNLCVCEERVEKIIDLVYDGMYAVGLILVSEENRDMLYQKCMHRGISWIPISSFSAHIQIGRNHPLADRKSVSLEELTAYPRATMAQDEMEPTLYGAHVHGYNPHIQKKRIVINDKSTMYALLTHTDAYYIGLDLSNIRRGNREVCYVPIRDLDNSYTLVFLHLSQHALTPVEKELLSDVREIVSATQKGGETAL